MGVEVRECGRCRILEPGYALRCCKETGLEEKERNCHSKQQEKVSGTRVPLRGDGSKMEVIGNKVTVKEPL